MRTLSGVRGIKRVAIIMLLLFSLLAVALALFISFFNINNHAQWLSEQLEKQTGYQVDFELISINGWQPAQFSVTALSVAKDNKQLLQIDKINILIGQWDIWQRQLAIDLVELTGVHIWVDQLSSVTPSPADNNAVKNRVEAKNKAPLLPWQTLTINKLRITKLSADIKDKGKSLQLQQGALSADNLLLIKDNKLLTQGIKGKLQLDAKQLNLQRADTAALRLNFLSLKSEFNLQTLQAQLQLTIKQIGVALPEQREIIVDNSSLELQLDKNRVTLQRLFANLFSGELELQAAAQLSINPFATPIFSIKALTVLSLLIKNMHLTIPAFMQASENENEKLSQTDKKLPIETLLLKQVYLQNLQISSEDKQFPLTVKELTVRINDFTPIQNNQLINLSTMDKQAGLFALQFTYLQWRDTLIEQFKMAGSLTEEEQSLLLLQPLFSE